MDVEIAEIWAKGMFSVVGGRNYWRWNSKGNQIGNISD